MPQFFQSSLNRKVGLDVWALPPMIAAQQGTSQTADPSAY